MIERDMTGSELTRFTKLHTGAIVTVRVGSRDEISKQPFRGLSVDGDDVVIATGDGIGKPHHGHRVTGVEALRLRQTEGGADAAIVIRSRGGIRTEVRFHSPMRADLLDPVVE